MDEVPSGRYLADEAASIAFARELVDALPENAAGWIVLLDGELGAGKSTMARAMLRHLGHAGPVPSPTYTLVEPYDLPGGLVYHVDLYRVSDPGELGYLGFDELDEGLLLIEWPERAPALAEQADLRVRLSYAGSGRRVAVEALSGRGFRLAALPAAR